MQLDERRFMNHLQAKATYYHTALLLGLCEGREAVAWADVSIQTETDPHTALFDVSLTSPLDLSALRHAIAPLTVNPVPMPIVEEMLRLAADDLASGRRSVTDTVRVLAQMRRMLVLPAALGAQLATLENEHMLAGAGIGLSLAESEAQVVSWLSPYAWRPAL